MKDYIYELKFVLGKDARGLAEMLHSALVGQGFRETDIIEDESERTIKVSVFLPSSGKAQATRGRVKALKLGRFRSYIKKLRRGDWVDKWKKGLKPFRITKDLTVVPLRYKQKKLSRDARKIHLDMTMAFGSGLHPTTRSVASFLGKFSGKYGSFLDVGTGTGILAIVASRYGAGRIWALDIEEEAVSTAKNNFEMNGVNVELAETADIKKFRKKEKFDFVAANLITDVLIENRGKILSFVRDGGYLAVSGISLNNLKRFRRSFDSRGLKCLRVTKEKDWAGILYRYLSQGCKQKPV